METVVHLVIISSIPYVTPLLSYYLGVFDSGIVSRYLMVMQFGRICVLVY